MNTDTVNQMVSPGKLFAVTGQNVRVAGKDARLLLVSASGTPKISVGVGRLVDNDPGRLAGIVPELPAGRAWKIEVQTRYAGSKELKDLRVITSDFTLTVPAASDPAASDEAAEGGPASEAGTT